MNLCRSVGAGWFRIRVTGLSIIFLDQGHLAPLYRKKILCLLGLLSYKWRGAQKCCPKHPRPRQTENQVRARQKYKGRERTTAESRYGKKTKQLQWWFSVCASCWYELTIAFISQSKRLHCCMKVMDRCTKTLRWVMVLLWKTKTFRISHVLQLMHANKL